MVYTIKMKRRILGIPFTQKIKNVKFHNFPTDFNNSQFLLVVMVNEDRRLYNLNNYDNIVMPAVAFVNTQQQSQQQPPQAQAQQEQTEGQKELLNQI